MLTRLLALIATIMLAASPASAAFAEYWSDNKNWAVYTDALHDGTPFCTLMGGYEEDEFLGVHFIPTRNVAAMSFTQPTAKAANFAPNRTVTLALTFIDSYDFDDGWGDREFDVGEGEGGLTRIFTSSNMDAEVLMNDVAEGTTVAFTMHDGNRIVAAYDLSGSARAISKLRECGYSRRIY